MLECRRISSAIVCAARSSARTGESDPPKLPTGERTPSIMKAFFVTGENLSMAARREGVLGEELVSATWGTVGKGSQGAPRSPSGTRSIGRIASIWKRFENSRMRVAACEGHLSLIHI